MHFLRFGSSIPGSYYGCCAIDIIQMFSYDPDTKASIQLVHGDSGAPFLDDSKGYKYLGMTYREIFKSHLRIGTFGLKDMPNHTFFAVMTKTQVEGGIGRRWLEILKEEGFEFVRTIDNSVYTGDCLDGEGIKMSSHPNYIFALYRNIGAGRIEDPYTPPKLWTDLGGPVVEPNSFMTKAQKKEADAANKAYHTERWKAIGKATIYTEAELLANGVNPIMAGKRSKYPPQIRSDREAAEKKDPSFKPSADLFSYTVPPPPVAKKKVAPVESKLLGADV